VSSLFQSEPFVEAAVGKYQPAFNVLHDNGVVYVFHQPPIAGLAFTQRLLRLLLVERQLLLRPIRPIPLLPYLTNATLAGCTPVPP